MREKLVQKKILHKNKQGSEIKNKVNSFLQWDNSSFNEIKIKMCLIQWIVGFVSTVLSQSTCSPWQHST